MAVTGEGPSHTAPSDPLRLGLTLYAKAQAFILWFLNTEILTAQLKRAPEIEAHHFHLIRDTLGSGA